MGRLTLCCLLLFALCSFKEKNKPAANSLPAVTVPKFKKDTFNIIKFGALADGFTLNTKSINSAITTCSNAGGGVVLIPNGLWLTGPVELKSNVNLHLQQNAVLNFTANFNQYPLVETNWEGLRAARNQSPLSATNATNIAITGKGIIDGNGDAWRMVKKDKLSDSQWKKLVASGGVVSDDKKTWYPSLASKAGANTPAAGVMAAGKTLDDYKDIKDFLRPNLLVFTRCRNILLDGVTFQNSPAWCLHPLMSEHLTVRNVIVKNPWYAQNGDGIDVESCSNVVIENSVFDVGDDGICIKSGRDEEGRKRGMPTKNVLVRNCTVYHAHGGFVIGSEMSGGANNIFVEDCSFIGTDIGLRFKTTRGRGGLVENIFIKNINMKNIVGEAILFDMYYAAKDPILLAGEKREPPKVETQPVTEATPRFQNFDIRNIVCDGAEKAIFVRGIPEMNVRNIVMADMVFQSVKGVEITEGSNIVIRRSKFYTKESDPLLQVHNSTSITFDNISYNPGAETLLALYGDKSTGIRLLNTDASKAKQKVNITYGAQPAAFKEN